MLQRVLPLVLLVSPALAQLDCDGLERLPLDVFQGTASAGAPWEVHTAVLAGDLAIVDSPSEPVGTLGETGALYIHRRLTGGWVLEQTLDLFDTLAPETGFSDFADQWAIDDATIFARFRDGAQTLSPRRIAVFEKINGIWQMTQTIDSDPAFFQEGIFGSFLAAEGGRLVVGSFAAVAFQGHAPGTLETFERDLLGYWVRVDLTTGVNLQPSGPRAVDLESDRLAVAYGDLYVYERIPTGWRLEHEVDVTALPSSTPGQVAVSVALAGDRVILGGLENARTFVFDLATSGSITLMQEIEPYLLPGSSLNPPYSGLVAAEANFLVVAVAEDLVGYPTVRFFEWYDGEYRPFDVLRAGAGISAVSIDNARAFVAAPWLDPAAPVAADARLEVRRLDGARAVPHCGDAARLLVSGSGSAPFDDATVHGYELPAGTTVMLVSGPSPGLTIFGNASLCIDAGQGLARFGAPIAATAAGGFSVRTRNMDLSSSAAWLIAGGSFTLQGVFRDGGVARETNALRITLCD